MKKELGSLFMGLLLTISASVGFANTTKEQLMSNYQQAMTIKRQALIENLEKSDKSVEEKNATLNAFDSVTDADLKKMETLTDEQIEQAKLDPRNKKKACFFSSNHLFIGIKELKMDPPRGSALQKAALYAVAVPVFFTLDVILLPVSVVMGFIDSDYGCEK